MLEHFAIGFCKQQILCIVFIPNTFASAPFAHVFNLFSFILIRAYSEQVVISRINTITIFTALSQSNQNVEEIDGNKSKKKRRKKYIFRNIYRYTYLHSDTCHTHAHKIRTHSIIRTQTSVCERNGVKSFLLPLDYFIVFGRTLLFYFLHCV